MKRRSSSTWRGVLGAAAVLLGGWARGADDEGGGPAFQADELLDLLKGIIEEDARPAPSVLGDIDLKGAPAEVKRVARVLRETRMDLSIEKQGLRDVLKLLGETSGLNFAISPKAKAALEAEKPEVDLSLRGLSLENVLNLISIQLGEYRFTIRYGLIYLILDEEYRPATVLRFYDVSDLTRPRPDFVAPKLALGSPEEKR